VAALSNVLESGMLCDLAGIEGLEVPSSKGFASGVSDAPPSVDGAPVFELCPPGDPSLRLPPLFRAAAAAAACSAKSFFEALPLFFRVRAYSQVNLVSKQ